jgi:hypothetical protein
MGSGVPGHPSGAPPVQCGVRLGSIAGRKRKRLQLMA